MKCVISKGRSLDSRVEKKLLSLIQDEMYAVQVYSMHEAIVDGRGFTKLSKKFSEEVREELGHAFVLMERMLVFDSIPQYPATKQVPDDIDIKSIIERQLSLEEDALKAYREAIDVAIEAKDVGTRLILEDILSDEEGHYDWLKTQLERIEDVGIGNYLSKNFYELEDDEEDEEDDE